jgi:hypothetical protein
MPGGGELLASRRAQANPIAEFLNFKSLFKQAKLVHDQKQLSEARGRMFKSKENQANRDSAEGIAEARDQTNLDLQDKRSASFLATQELQNQGAMDRQLAASETAFNKASAKPQPFEAALRDFESGNISKGSLESQFPSKRKAIKQAMTLRLGPVEQRVVADIDSALTDPTNSGRANKIMKDIFLDLRDLEREGMNVDAILEIYGLTREAMDAIAKPKHIQKSLREARKRL